MLTTIEAEIDAAGEIHPLRFTTKLPAGPALLTLLTPRIDDDALGLAEQALAEDWLRPEEDAAWAHLQQAR